VYRVQEKAALEQARKQLQVFSMYVCTYSGHTHVYRVQEKAALEQARKQLLLCVLVFSMYSEFLCFAHARVWFRSHCARRKLRDRLKSNFETVFYASAHIHVYVRKLCAFRPQSKHSNVCAAGLFQHFA
jgi:hypothetical protein